MERGETDFRAAAGVFGSVYLFYPVSPVASLAAGVWNSGFAARAPCSSHVCVCVRGGEGQQVLPLSPPSPLPSLRERDERTKARTPANRLLLFPGRFVPVLMMPPTMMMMVMIAGLLCSCKLL